MSNKKILFIVSNLEDGGVSKSLVSLINIIDKERYEITLFILYPHGIFKELLLSNKIRIITDKKTELLTQPFPKSIFSPLKNGYYFVAILSLLRAAVSMVNKSMAGWILSRLITPIKEEFDVAIDYNGQHQLYYLVDKIKAKKKVTFFHSDYSKWSYYYSMDKRYYPFVDKIFTISDICVQSLKVYFPSQAYKISLMENISSIEIIEKMSMLPIKDFENDNTLTFTTLGHISNAKGTDLAIESAAILKKMKIQFKWYFIGSIKDKDFYTNLVNKFQVKDQIIFLGLRSNPYPYIRSADLFIHPSQFEGRSIALDEAKLLCKPIVVTNFSTVADQFCNHINASICEMTPKNLANAIEELIVNEELRKGYIKYLEMHKKDNTSEVEKLYSIFESL